MEHGRRHDEEPKEDELDGEAQQDDGLARVHRFRLGEQARAHDLDQEGEDVADDEDLCEARGLDRGERGAVEVEDQAAEDHVDRGGEQGGGDEEAEGLDHEEAEAGGVGRGEEAAQVACDFDWEGCLSVGFQQSCGLVGIINIRIHPMIRGIKYHARRRMMMNVCHAHPRMKPIRNIIAAAPDGVYLYRLYDAMVGFRGEDGRVSKAGRQDEGELVKGLMIQSHGLPSEKTRELLLYTIIRVDILTLFFFSLQVPLHPPLLRLYLVPSHFALRISLFIQ